MAIAYIEEYRDLALDSKGTPIGIPMVGEESSSQIVTFTTAVSSQTFRKGTRFVRIISDTACHRKFGTSPTALTGVSPKMAANTYEYFGVRPGDKVSFVT